MKYDEKKSPSMLEGQAYHIALQDLYEKKEGDVRAIVLKYLEEQDEQTDWGATGSLEKSLEVVLRAVEFYLAERPKYDVEKVEQRFFSIFTDERDIPMAVPLKAFADLVVRDSSHPFIVDHKLVSQYADADNAAYELQACALFLAAKKTYPDLLPYVVFDEMKKSKNRNGEPRLRSVKVDVTPVRLMVFTELFKRIVKELSGESLINRETGEVKLLPNPFMSFGWEQSWADFCEEACTGISPNHKEI